MFRRFSVNFALFSIGVDALMVIVTLGIASALRPGLSSLPLIQYIPAYMPLPWPLYFLFPVLWIGILFLVSVYDGRHNMRASDEFASLSIGSAVALVSMAGTLYLSFRDVSRAAFLLFFSLAYLGMVAWRIFARWLLPETYNWKRAQRRVLVVGGRRGRRPTSKKCLGIPRREPGVNTFSGD